MTPQYKMQPLTTPRGLKRTRSLTRAWTTMQSASNRIKPITFSQATTIYKLQTATNYQTAFLEAMMIPQIRQAYEQTQKMFAHLQEIPTHLRLHIMALMKVPVLKIVEMSNKTWSACLCRLDRLTDLNPPQGSISMRTILPNMNSQQASSTNASTSTNMEDQTSNKDIKHSLQPGNTSSQEMNQVMTTSKIYDKHFTSGGIVSIGSGRVSSSSSASKTPTACWNTSEIKREISTPTSESSYNQEQRKMSYAQRCSGTPDSSSQSKSMTNQSTLMDSNSVKQLENSLPSISMKQEEPIGSTRKFMKGHKRTVSIRITPLGEKSLKDFPKVYKDDVYPVGPTMKEIVESFYNQKEKTNTVKAPSARCATEATVMTQRDSQERFLRGRVWKKEGQISNAAKNVPNAKC